MGKTVAVAADHSGFPLKARIVEYLTHLNEKVIDLGTMSESPVDYPDFVYALGQVVLGGQASCGILICGSGVGASIAANKIPGIRAGLCHDTFSAHQAVEDDNINVLCLGARVIGLELAKELITTWLNARFSGAERHVRRLEKVELIEKGLYL